MDLISADMLRTSVQVSNGVYTRSHTVSGYDTQITA